MKKLVKIVFAVLLFAELVLFASASAAVSSAETVPQLRLRLFAEAQARHPDVWNGCDAVCINARVASAPFLVGLAKQANVSLDDLARYSVTRSFEWGQAFENLYKRPPTIYDWTVSYADNAEVLRVELAASPEIFAVNQWADNHYFKYKPEYAQMQ